MRKFFERENAEKKFVESGNCECNWRYTQLNNFWPSRLVNRYAKQARETFGFSMTLA